jgi:FAD/FMN-containing dehydrogenase
MVAVSAWGRLSQNPHQLISLPDRTSSASLISTHVPGICFGNGRSYGDVCLNNQGFLWQTKALNRMISFDADTGVLHCEAGVLLRDIQRLFAPRGWLLPVTPGTQLVTVGGAIANDVHGKNHHVHGTFGDNVKSLRLQRTDGSLSDCSTEHGSTGLFRATIGGLGLTGVILDAHLQLRRIDSTWLDTETIPYQSLAAFFELAEHSEANWEHTVAWIDCLSGERPRGIFLRANHASSAPEGNAVTESRHLSIPLTPPVSFVNKLTLKPLNAAYYYSQLRKAGRGVSHYETFFYPLDAILNWNRMYGPRGFFQYQCVVPSAAANQAVSELLREVQRSGQGSFLAVLKTFAERAPAGMLSFPTAGATLALDFPDQGEHTQALLRRLDSIVSSARGRLYPAKDARMSASMFSAGYPQLAEFLTYRDPGISSDMSRRLLGS